MLGMIKKLKLMGNNGGVSYGKTIMKKEVQRELRVIRKAFTKPNTTYKNNINKTTLYIQNRPIYNEFPFFLAKNESHEMVSFTAFEIDYLINLLLSEVERLFLSPSDRREKSVLYRLFERPIKASFKSQYEALQQHQLNADITPEEAAVFKNLLNFRSMIYKNATIYGNSFSCRGSKFREINQPVNKNTARRDNPPPDLKTLCGVHSSRYFTVHSTGAVWRQSLGGC